MADLEITSINPGCNNMTIQDGPFGSQWILHVDGLASGAYYNMEAKFAGSVAMISFEHADGEQFRYTYILPEGGGNWIEPE